MGILEEIDEEEKIRLDAMPLDELIKHVETQARYADDWGVAGDTAIVGVSTLTDCIAALVRRLKKGVAQK